MNQTRKRILLITYVFPPFAAVGVYRILKFCKYLGQFGFDPVVLTPENPSTMARDEGLLDLVPAGIPVHRTMLIEPFRGRPTAPGAAAESPSGKAVPASQAAAQPTPPSMVARLKRWVKRELTVPDGSVFWSWVGLWHGARAVRDENIDLILSSSPPQSIHLLGGRIARLTGKPHIVDFRDLWTQNTSYAEKNFPPRLAGRDRKYELKVLQRAAAVTVNTETFKSQLLQKNAFLSPDRVVVVNNGVDPDDFKPFLTRREPNEKFTMLYTGSLYGQHRNPEFFFAAVKTWLDAKATLREKVRLVFVGNWAAGFDGLPASYGLEKLVERTGWMPQREALRAPFAADLLLLFQGFDPVLSAAIPRTLYEYMITDKPILAFAPPGEIPDAIARYQAGVCLFDPAPEPIIAFLDRAYQGWLERRQLGSHWEPGLRPMPELETLGQVEKLANLCRKLI